MTRRVRVSRQIRATREDFAKKKTRTRQPLHEENRVGRRRRRVGPDGALRPDGAFFSLAVRPLRDLALLFARLGLRLALLPHRGIPRGRVERALRLCGGVGFRSRVSDAHGFIVKRKVVHSSHRVRRGGDGVEHHPGLSPQLVRLRAVYVDHLAELRERRAQRLSQLCRFERTRG